MRHALILALAAVSLGGCALTRHGVLRSLDGAEAMDVTVTIESDVVRVRGVDPTTGETFAGHFAREEGSGDLDRAMAPGAGPPTGADPVPGRAGGRTTMDVSGILEGDAGSRLRCSIQVERRVLIRGSGLCRTDEHSGRPRSYSLIF